MIRFWSSAVSTAILLLFVCSVNFTAVARAADVAPPAQPFPHPPAWVADQALYEVNLRQFSEAGTVEEFRKALPRLKTLGVGTLWFMPVNPIGVAGRTGKLGSPYAIVDYRGFNPELGTLEQFKSAVDEAHRMGFRVIIDWVATHTALDHPWLTQHADWYKHDAAGQLVHPMPTWLDVVALNYASADMRKEMIDAMSFWVSDVGVDGFRCDSAEFVPVDFWVQVRNALRQIKPVFLLAEGNDPKLVSYAFDAAYSWYLPPNTEGIAKGTKTVADLTNFFKAEAGLLKGDGFRLNYTTNHDKNAWEGTTKELLGDGVSAFTVLTFTVPGMPLIYNGQEAGLDKRLNFFDHDPIAWHDDPIAGLYKSLAELKHRNRALWSGLGTGPLQFLDSKNPSVLEFQRTALGDSVVVTLNLSAKPVSVSPPAEAAKMSLVITSDSTPTGATIPPWGYRVWSSN